MAKVTSRQRIVFQFETDKTEMGFIINALEKRFESLHSDEPPSAGGHRHGADADRSSVAHSVRSRKRAESAERLRALTDAHLSGFAGHRSAVHEHCDVEPPVEAEVPQGGSHVRVLSQPGAELVEQLVGGSRVWDGVGLSHLSLLSVGSGGKP